jgi:hypothetical protein
MKHLKTYESFKEEKEITIGNVLTFKDKLKAILISHDEKNLLKGLEFTVSNIEEYDDEFVSKMIDAFIANVNEFIEKKTPTFFDKNFDTGYSGYKTVGSKHNLTKDLSLKEISKLIKKEINIEYPDVKVSIKTRNYSSIDVDINDLPFNPYSKEYDDFMKSGDDYSVWNNFTFKNRDVNMYNEQTLKIKSDIKKMMNQYNYDDSDSMVDYFDTRYYTSVNINDRFFKEKYYPTHTDVLRSKKFDDEWEEKKMKRKEIADKNKGSIKKGENILFNFKGNVNIPAGKYEGVVIKSPSGRSRMGSYYTIDFKVPNPIKEGTFRTYRLEYVKENDLEKN